MANQWNHKILDPENLDFDALALEIFRFQAQHNPVYSAYLDALRVNPLEIDSIQSIPYLPIRFFKTHAVSTGEFEPAVVFESSGTSGMVNSRHLVKDAALYTESFRQALNLFYGPVSEYCVLGLLPSYLERGSSSLVYMVNDLIQQSGHPESNFYLHDHDKLAAVLKDLEERGQKTLLIGVTYALLDFADRFPQHLKHTIVMETGGMKGRRKEMIRQEVHQQLKDGLGLAAIHSEYGMTELLSQAYSAGNGVFKCPPWMRVVLREEDDPFTIVTKHPGSGAINVIDLANVHSCSFIATDDAGKIHADGSFEIIGRIDNSDLRGCSLMIV